MFKNKRKNVSDVSILFLKPTFLCLSVASHKHKYAFLLRHIKVFIVYYYLSQKCVFYVFLFKHLLFSVYM